MLAPPQQPGRAGQHRLPHSEVAITLRLVATYIAAATPRRRPTGRHWNTRRRPVKRVVVTLPELTAAAPCATASQADIGAGAAVPL